MNQPHLHYLSMVTYNKLKTFTESIGWNMETGMKKVLKSEIHNIKYKGIYKSRRHLPPTVLCGCYFLHSATKHWAKLQKQKRVMITVRPQHFKDACVVHMTILITWWNTCDFSASFSQSFCVLSLWKFTSLVKWESGRRAVFWKLSRMLQHKTLLMSWQERFPDGQLPEPVPHHALWGTHCSAFVVFASCLWRSSRNDVGWCNAIWWSSPPIRLCRVDYLNHFIQCVAWMSNQKLLVQSFCDVLEVVPLRAF